VSTQIKNKNIILNYFLTYLLVATAGINFFAAGDVFLFIGFIIAGFLFLNRGLKIHTAVINILIFFAFIQMGQFIFAWKLPIYTFIGFYITALYGYFTIRVVGEKFINYYINIIYFICILSFVFFFLSLVFPSFSKFFITKIAPLTQPPFGGYTDLLDVIVYNFGAIKWQRNSGPFWEPGAFAGFTMIAMFFNYGLKKNILERKNIVFTIAILTTLSTAGYLSLFLYIAYIIFQKRKWYTIFILILALYSAYYAYNKLWFMEQKIQQHYDIAMGESVYKYRYVNRFSSIELDLKDLKKNPLFGISKNRNLRYGERNESKEKGKTWTHRNNGVTYYLSSYGILGFFAYFLFMFKSFKLFNLKYMKINNYHYVMFLLLLIIGMAEKYFMKSFFYALVFLFTLCHEKYKSFHKNG